MNRKLLMLLYAMFISELVSAGGSGMKDHDAEGYIKRCIAGLKNAKSTNLEDGRLMSEWSIAVVNWTSVDDYTTVVFEDNYYDPRAKDPSYIDDSPYISCLLNDAGDIARLSSPEEKDGVTSIVELVTPNTEDEEEAFNKLVRSVRQGIDVYVYDSVYQISDNEIVKIGETRVQKLDPQDYK